MNDLFAFYSYNIKTGVIQPGGCCVKVFTFLSQSNLGRFVCEIQFSKPNVEATQYYKLFEN